MPIPESANLFLARQTERLCHFPRRKRIVFPEGEDPRVIEAARRLSAERLVEPILLPSMLPSDDRYATLYFRAPQDEGRHGG